MWNDIAGIAIAIVALSWIFDILYKLDNNLLAWVYALVMYGVYLILAVAVCGYYELGPILAPTPLFLAMAAVQIRGARKEASPTQPPAELDALTREIREAIRRKEPPKLARDKARQAQERELPPWLHSVKAKSPQSTMSTSHASLDASFLERPELNRTYEALRGERREDQQRVAR
jgi:hypothetical protein